MSARAVRAALTRASSEADAPRILLSFRASDLLGLLVMDIGVVPSSDGDVPGSSMAVELDTLKQDRLRRPPRVGRDGFVPAGARKQPTSFSLLSHTMSQVSGPVLLSRLKDIQQCDDELAILVRRTVLEPFQPNLSEITSKKRPSKPSSAEFREMATQLGKLAMEIVNQNINTLRDMKVLRKQQSGEYQNAIKCLIDSACYAISSLKHMKAYTALKPLDIEKTTSNLVCRIVDLGEVKKKEQASLSNMRI